MNKLIKRLLSVGIITSSICLLPIGVSAEWKQDSKGWWNTEGHSYSTGWKQIESKWYYFNQDGYMKTGWLQSPNGKWYYLKNDGSMAVNETVNGYKVDNNGVWVQNTMVNSNNTTNTSTNVANTANSNNMTNLTNNVDNSTNTSANTTLNNTGSINNGNINNGTINSNTTNDIDVTVNNTSKSEDTYYKELKKNQQKSQESLKLYYEKELKNAKENLEEAKKDLERAKTQLTIKTYVKDEETGQWNFKGVADQTKIDSAQKRVNTYQNLVDYYSKLLK